MTQLGSSATPVFTTNVCVQNRQIPETSGDFGRVVGDEDRGCQKSALDHCLRQALSFSERHPGPLYLSVVSRGARRKKKYVQSTSTDIARIRNRKFLIWAKGEGGVSPARTPIFKKYHLYQRRITVITPHQLGLYLNIWW